MRRLLSATLRYNMDMIFRLLLAAVLLSVIVVWIKDSRDSFLSGTFFGFMLIAGPVVFIRELNEKRASLYILLPVPREALGRPLVMTILVIYGVLIAAVSLVTLLVESIVGGSDINFSALLLSGSLGLFTSQAMLLAFELNQRLYRNKLFQFVIIVAVWGACFGAAILMVDQASAQTSLGFIAAALAMGWWSQRLFNSRPSYLLGLSSDGMWVQEPKDG